jgi:hypothetical protein
LAAQRLASPEAARIEAALEQPPIRVLPGTAGERELGGSSPKIPKSLPSNCEKIPIWPGFMVKAFQELNTTEPPLSLTVKPVIVIGLVPVLSILMAPVSINPTAAL